MTIRTFMGNALIAVSSTVGASTSVIVTQAIENDAFNKPYVLAGFPVPNWVGIVFFAVFMIIGILMAVNQPTPIDHKFRYPWLKPIYSFAFGVLVTVFGLPMLYPDITVWQMIIPILFFTAIGAVVVYYVIDFFTSEKLWGMVKIEAYSGAGELLSMLFDYIKGIVKAILNRSDK